ncbi:MAG: DNA polymerase III [Treponemataceae bacterium]|nr:DNA polymerase III [Treponemataceae bacterium]
MFDNLLYQNAADLLAKDLQAGGLPQSLLFSGPASSGKLTAALELSRITSCKAPVKGVWTCTCPSCLRHKALASTVVLIAGPRDCSLEIGDAKDALLQASRSNASWIQATRYLFLRSVRKLTVRFSPLLWENDKNASKVSPIVSDIDELLEEIDPIRPLPSPDKLEKLLTSLEKDCRKLESDWMYDSIPINQIRSASEWLRLSVPDGKKMLIIENADRMQDSVRNALLKIIEEPPEDVIFVLTTAARSAVMPTILSRVRTYHFHDRTVPQQQEVINRVFHNPEYASKESVADFLSEYLPVPSPVIQEAARGYLNQVMQGQHPDTAALLKDMENFEPRLALAVFYRELIHLAGNSLRMPENSTPDMLAGATEKASRMLTAIRNSYQDITIYNQKPAQALEVLYERIR